MLNVLWILDQYALFLFTFSEFFLHKILSTLLNFVTYFQEVLLIFFLKTNVLLTIFIAFYGKNIG